MAYKANEDTKWSFITETLSTVVHGQLKNTYKEVAFVRVIISIFMKLVVVRGFCWLTSCSIRTKCVQFIYSCGASVAILRTYITHPSVVRVHLSSVEDNEELQPKLCQRSTLRVRVPTSVVKKMGGQGADKSLGELIFGIFGNL